MAAARIHHEFVSRSAEGTSSASDLACDLAIQHLPCRICVQVCVMPVCYEACKLFKPASTVDSPMEPARAPQVAAFFDTATLRGKAAAAAGGLQRTPALLSVAGRCHDVQVRIILGFLLGYVRFQGL